MNVETALQGAAAFETLGIVGVLVLVLISLAAVVRVIYKNERQCQAGRLKDAEHRNELSRELGALTGEVKTLQGLHQAHLFNMVQGNKKHASDTD